MRHFNTSDQSLNFYPFWRNPHLLACALPETVFFHLCGQSGCGVFSPSQALSKHEAAGLFNFSTTCDAVRVCVVLAAIGAIRLKEQAFSNDSIRIQDQTFSPIAYITIQDQNFSANAAIRLKDQTFLSNARIAIQEKTLSTNAFLSFLAFLTVQLRAGSFREFCP